MTHSSQSTHFDVPEPLFRAFLRAYGSTATEYSVAYHFSATVDGREEIFALPSNILLYADDIHYSPQNVHTALSISRSFGYSLTEYIAAATLRGA